MGVLPRISGTHRWPRALLAFSLFVCVRLYLTIITVYDVFARLRRQTDKHTERAQRAFVRGASASIHQSRCTAQYIQLRAVADAVYLRDVYERCLFDNQLHI